MTERLSEATLGTLPPQIDRPSYDRAKLSNGVVHIGVGAFHRAHQAVAFDALARAGDLRWGVVGASLRSRAVRHALSPQDWLYSLAVEENEHRAVSVVGSIVDMIVAPESPSRLIDAIASPQTLLMTVTVTEKGYKLDPASGLLDESDPDVRADLATLDRPITLPGYLAAGLRRRMDGGLPGITIISCDNLSQNGRKFHASVTSISRAHDPALAHWIEDRCAFPNTMVDRIVPATTSDDIARAAMELGALDLATVRTEPFSQWVIEDRFAGERPDLEPAGVQFARDVRPWENAKLRMLNGAHSAIAYLGALAGLSTVDEFVAESWGRAFVHLLWDELAATLDPPEGLDFSQYRTALMRRLRNSALQHRLIQIAMDGSQKIPQRLVPASIALLERDGRRDAIALAIAAWIRWQRGRDEQGLSFMVDDPLASTTGRLLDNERGAREQVRAIFSLESVFPGRLAGDTDFQVAVAHHLEQLYRCGARATVEQFAQSAEVQRQA